MATNMTALPEGFVLEPMPQAPNSALPEGFVLENASADNQQQPPPVAAPVHIIDPTNPLEAPRPPGSEINLPAPDPGYVPPANAGPATEYRLPGGLPDPTSPESTAGETAIKYAENIPPLLKRTAGGLMQDAARRDVPAGTSMMALDPRVGGLLKMGLEKVNKSIIEGVTGETVEGDPLSDLGARIFADATADLQENAPNVDPWSVKGLGYDLATALTQMAPSVAAGVATKSPTIGISVLGGQVYGDRYGESIASGRTPDEALQDATYYALAEAIPERIPMGILMKPGMKFLPRVAGSFVAEGVQEVFTEMLQSGYDAGILDEQMTWGEARERLLRAGVLGGFMGGTMAVGTHPFVGGPADPGGPGAEPGGAAPLPDGTLPEGFVADPAPQNVPEGAVPAETVIGEESSPQGSPRAEIEDILNDERTVEEIRAEKDAERAARIEAIDLAQSERHRAWLEARGMFGERPVSSPPAAEEGDLSDLPDGALGAAFESSTDSIGIFTPEEQDILRKSGAIRTLQSDTGVEYEAFNEEQLFAERDRRGKIAAAELRARVEADQAGTRDKPADAAIPGAVDEAAAQAHPDPSPAQKEAGNYQKGHMKWQGLDIAIENAAGSERTGTGANGVPWSVTMPAHYGYVKRTNGADGDQVDVYVGQSPESDQVVVIDQIDPATGKFDEHKVMLGTTSDVEALSLYDAGFSDGSGQERRGAVTQMTVSEFKEWLANGNTKKPLAYRKPEPTAPGPALVEQVESPVAPAPPSREQPGTVIPEAQPAGLTADEARAEAVRLIGEGKDTGGIARTEDGREFTWSADHPVTPKAPRNVKGRIQIQDDAGNIHSFTKVSLRREGQKDADAESPRPTVLQTQTEPIGKNAEGEDIYEDPNGVRYVSKGGVRFNEPVQVAPTREGGVNTSVERPARNDRYRTTTEETSAVKPKKPRTPQLPPLAGMTPLGVTSPVESKGQAGERTEVPFPDLADAIIAGGPTDRYREWLGQAPDADLREMTRYGLAGHYAEREIERRAATPSQSAPESAIFTVEEPTDGTTEQIRADRAGPSEEAPARNVQRTEGERDAEPVSQQPGRTGEPDGGQPAQPDASKEPAPKRLQQEAPAPGMGAAERRGDRAERPGVQRPAERKPEQRTVGANFRIDPGDKIAVGGLKTKARDNLAAIRALKQIEAEGRPATVEEQRILAAYTGWGGLVSAFPKTGVGDDFSKGWADVGRELRETLTDAEYASARASTPNAHYTSVEVVRAMWGLAERVGFKGGNVLEPGMGIGYFLATVPEGVAARTRLHGVELDSITGRLARLLYPASDIRVEGFEDARFPENHFDMAIGNVPFADVRPNDPKYNKGKHVLHDYYFVKTLALTRPGGYVMFITSRYTMDKQSPAVRKALAKDADLVGAIRLPNNAFKGIANTDVTTDIIVLRKRKAGEKARGPAWTGLDRIDDIPVNEYFARNPDMMAGHMTLAGTMYGSNEPTLDPADRPLGEHLREIAARLAEGAATNDLTYDPERPDNPATRQESETIEAPDSVKEGAFFVEGGQLYQKRYSRGESIPIRQGRSSQGVTKTDHDRLVRLAEIRDATREVLRTQMEGSSDARQDEARRALNKVYDTFAKKHGPINDTRVSEIRLKDGTVREQRRMPNLRLFKEDPDGMLVASLEEYDLESNTAKKGAIFTERVLSPERKVKSVETVEDGLLASLNQHNRVDLDYIADLTGRTVAQVTGELRGQIYFDPEQRAWVSADEYLSGNVRQRLGAAEIAAKEDQALAGNVEALRAVQPEDLPPSAIEARLGAPWIPKEDVARFVAELLGDPAARVAVTHSVRDAEWNVEAAALAGSVPARIDWGTGRADAVTLIELALNQKRPEIADSVYENGVTKSVKNVDATLAAQEKQQNIKARFRDWVWEDAARGQRLARLYNDNFNNIRLRSFDGSHLTFPGMKEIVPGGWFQGLRPHQANAVWRVMQSGNTLLAHVVGAGKTMTMVASGMEMKRVGLVNKPMYVVPNHMLDQFSREMLQLYPNARILVADEQQFHTNRRRLFVNKIATGNWDAIVITHSAFGKIPISPEFEEQSLQRTIDEYEALMREANAGSERSLVKRLEKQKKRWEARLEALAAREHKDTGVTFEETGVDFVFLDEAHVFKNLETRTKMQNVKNLQTAGSQKAFDLHMKLLYLDQNNPGRSAAFATGTPISNSMVEMYTMQRYLQPRMLRTRGLDHFDAWAGQFGESVTALELDPTGAGYRLDTRFARFVNVPELLQMYRDVADVQTAGMLNLPTPALKDGRAEVVESKPSPEQVEAVNNLKVRLDRLKGKRPEKGEDNPLKVVNDGRHIALDMRTRDPQSEDYADSKVNKAVRAIHRIWRDTERDKLTQMVFIDLSAPGGHGFSVYEDMRAKLLDMGVPAKEIAFIHDYPKDSKKARLFADVRAGKTRILFGSTMKMGVGTNVQQRLVALHHIDAPWRPSDVEQRDGRIMRQGNENPEIEIFRYVTSGTFDAYMWQTLETKHRFIQQVMTGDLTVREMEDLDSDSSLLDPATVKAIASGNPLVMEKAGIDADIAKLTRLDAAHRDAQFKIRSAVASLPAKIGESQERLTKIEADIRARKDTRGKAFEIAIDGKTYTERAAAGSALIKAVGDAVGRIKAVAIGRGKADIGKFAGFDLGVIADASGERLTLGGEYTYSVELETGGGSERGVIQRLENAAGSLDARLDRAKADLAEQRKTLTDLKARQDQPFGQADKLAQLQRRSKEIEDELRPKQGQAATEQTDDTERYSLSEEGEPFEGPRATGIPAGAAEISVFRNTQPLQGHADYKAAKAGDIEAAVRMVGDLVKPESVESARKAFGEDVLFLPVVAEEASGRNAVPDAVADYFAAVTGAEVIRDVVQANRAYHTGAKAIVRLSARVRFAGPVEKGRRYVLVDDVTVMGSTLADLAEHIQRGGGEVVGVVTLVNGSRTRILTPEASLIRKLEERYGDAISEIFGIEPAGLTAAEAAYVINFRDADSLRAKSASGKLEAERRLRSKGVRPSEAEKGKLSRQATTEPAPEAGFSLAERQRIEDVLRAELDAIGLGDIALKVRDELNVEAAGRKSAAQGRFVSGLIEISMQARNKRVTLNHEAIHALRDLNLFSGAEWAALERKANAEWREKYRIDKRYAGEPEWVRVEEAVADAYGHWAAGDVKAGGLVLRAFNKIKRLLERIGNALRGLGYRSAEDVFEAIRSGEVGSRPRTETGTAKEAAERYSLVDPEDGTIANEAKRQRAMQGFIAKGHPLDRALRIPFHIFGGITDKGEWKPGKHLSDNAGRIIGEAKFDSDGRFAWLNGPLMAARAGLLDRYGLTKEYTDRDRERGLDERRIMFEGAEILKTLKEQGVGADEARVLQAVLTGEEIASEDWQAVSEPIRKAIDALGEEAVSLGMVSPESYERNRGTYLHRVYEKHEANETQLGKWFSQFMGRRRKQIVGNQFKGRGLFLDVKAGRLFEDMDGQQKMPEAGSRFAVLDRMSKSSKRAIDRVYWPESQAVPARFADYTNKGSWEVRAVRGETVTLWRDFTKAERTNMGEILDARYTIAKTFMQMAHDLATGRFYKDIATNPEWARTAEPESHWVEASEFSRMWNDPDVQWVKVPDAAIPKTGGKKKWAALSGMYVRAEIWRDLNELDAMQRKTLWTTLLTQWKLNKTARSPVVHMNNIMSNLVFMDMADVRGQDLLKGLRSYAKGDRFYQDAVDHGAFGADMMSQEIRKNVLEPVLEEIRNQNTDGRSPLESRMGILGALANGIWNKARALDRKMIDLYRVEDEVFRMATYMRRLSLGDTPAQAADFARQQFLDYDIRAPWVNAARRTVLPFISYTYRAVPVISRSIASRPWKMAKYFTVAYALNALAYMIAPGDEDEERRSMRDQEQGSTWIGSPRMMRMPYRDDYGNPVFLDIRRWIPAGDIFDLNQGSSALPVPAPIQFGGPMMLGAELMLNRSAFTGDDIVNTKADDIWSKGEKLGDWAWKSWMPSAAWVPGSWYWEKIDRATSGARDYGGRPYQLPEAIASSVGIKLKPQDVELNFEFKRLAFARVERDLRTEARRLGRDLSRGIVTQKEYSRQMARIVGQLDTLAENRRETFRPESPKTQ